MIRATMYHFRGEPHEPVRIEVPRVQGDNGFACVRLSQQGVEVTIDTNDAAWMEELEGAIRQAREGLEKRTTVPCYCEGLRASCPACDGTGQAPKARAA